jgi:hypothetical protein
MVNNSKQCWGEKWILKVGKMVFESGKYGNFMELILLVCATTLASMLFLLLMRTPAFDKGAMLIAICAAGAVMGVLLFIQTFERRHFYRIIHNQKKRIEQLEKELRDAK